ncbi:MAG: ABC transporter permease [Chloroflexi bacterium]|nr:ABC transporter permease [Chloroflexota bacterium]
MQRYIAQRIITSIPVLLILVVLIFGLLRIAGGDPAAVIAGKDAPQWQIEEIRENLGLNKPLYVQLGIYIKDILTGNLGASINSKTPVLELLGKRVVPTLSLAIAVELLTLPIAIPLGIIAAWKANTWIDRSIMIFASLGFSIPIFFLGFILIWAFALNLPWFPAAGYVPPTEHFGRFLYRLVLPGLSTAILFWAFLTRMTRATMIEVLQEDYIRTARSKGLAEGAVLMRHALKNAALPIATIVGWGIAELLAGLVVTEQVFAIPGIGRMIVDAIVRRDYPVIQGAMIVVSVIQVGVNLLVDLSYAFFDPRIKY